jgi:hypothetical protein
MSQTKKKSLPVNSIITAIWSFARNRREFFEDYAQQNRFDPKDVDMWYIQPKERILNFKVSSSSVVSPSFPFPPFLSFFFLSAPISSSFYSSFYLFFSFFFLFLHLVLSPFFFSTFLLFFFSLCFVFLFLYSGSKQDIVLSPK